MFNFNQNFEDDDSFSKQYKSQFQEERESFFESGLFKILMLLFGVIVLVALSFFAYRYFSMEDTTKESESKSSIIEEINITEPAIMEEEINNTSLMDENLTMDVNETMPSADYTKVPSQIGEEQYVEDLAKLSDQVD